MYFKAHSYVLSYFCCIITLGRGLILRSLFYSWRYNHSGRSLKVWVLVRNVWLCHSGFKSRSFFHCPVLPCIFWGKLSLIYIPGVRGCSIGFSNSMLSFYFGLLDKYGPLTMGHSVFWIDLCSAIQERKLTSSCFVFSKCFKHLRQAFILRSNMTIRDSSEEYALSLLDC